MYDPRLMSCVRLLLSYGDRATVRLAIVPGAITNCGTENRGGPTTVWNPCGVYEYIKTPAGQLWVDQRLVEANSTPTTVNTAIRNTTRYLVRFKHQRQARI